MSKSLIYILSDESCDIAVLSLQLKQEDFEVRIFFHVQGLMAAIADRLPTILLLIDPNMDSEALSILQKMNLDPHSEIFTIRLIPGDDQSSINHLFAPYSLGKIIKDSELKSRQLSFYTSSTMPLLRQKYSSEKPDFIVKPFDAVDNNTASHLVTSEQLIDIVQEMDEYERRLRNAFYCTRLELLQRQSSRSRTLENLLPTALTVAKKIIKEETLKAEKQLDFNLMIEESLCFINDHHFERLLEELVKNAVQFAHPHGRIEVTWFLGGLDAKLIVYNSGQGMPPEKLEELRKSFAEEFPVRYNAQWGLRIVSKIASLYNASIDISSQCAEYFAIEVTFPNVTANHPSVRKSATTGIPFVNASEMQTSE